MSSAAWILPNIFRRLVLRRACGRVLTNTSVCLESEVSLANLYSVAVTLHCGGLTSTVVLETIFERTQNVNGFMSISGLHVSVFAFG